MSAWDEFKAQNAERERRGVRELVFVIAENYHDFKDFERRHELKFARYAGETERMRGFSDCYYVETARAWRNPRLIELRQMAMAQRMTELQT